MSAWLQQWLKTAEDTTAGISRRQSADVERLTSVDDVVAECKKRGWHCLEIGDQIAILTLGGDLHILC